MPLKENDKRTVDYKGRLERKLCLARENPEPIFDLSDCNLKAVPNNIYSLCKVFRKTALYLQENKLSSLSGGGALDDLVLISQLDISSNIFTKLPSNINALKNLKVLIVKMNQLKELPDSIGDLKCLIHFDVSKNQLNKLPNTIGGCESLKFLDVRENRNLKSLPTELSRLSCLRELHIDSVVYYPPPNVCQGGVKAILQYLAEEIGEKYASTCNVLQSETTGKSMIEPDSFKVLQEKMKKLEKLKEEKQKELLQLEQQLIDENQKEIEVQLLLRDKKKELINMLKDQHKSLEQEILKAQETKDNQRALLIKECNNVEDRVNQKIIQILQHNKEMKEKLAKQSERERKEEEDHLLVIYRRNLITTKPLEKTALLVSMNELLKEEIKLAEARSTDKRLKFMDTLVTEDKLKFSLLRDLMKKYEKNQNALLERISKDEEMQKSAVSSLLERSDARLWHIANQINEVQVQLGVLTKLELTKRKLQAEEHLMELSRNRIALTELLLELFRHQSERRNELIESLRRIENAKMGVSDSFWLEQYQKLVQSKTQELVQQLKSIDPDLANEFFLRGVFYYLPVLDEAFTSVQNLESLNAEILAAAGVISEDDRIKILQAVQNYLARRTEITPSAPEDIRPSAPFISSAPSSKDYTRVFSTNEDCLVCMDLKADVIFVPCGHVCCCVKCSSSLTVCPLCRTPITQMLQSTSNASADKVLES